MLRSWVLCLLRQSWSPGTFLVERRLASLPNAVAGWIFAAFLAGGSGLSAQILSSTSNNIPGAASAASSTAVPSTVSGVVKNAVTGAPVPRALVRLNERAVLTDHDGNFRFDQNTSSSANVMVNKPGYYTGLEMQDSENLYLAGGANWGCRWSCGFIRRRFYEAGTVLGPDGVPLPRDFLLTAQRKYFDEMGHRWLQVGQDQTDFAWELPDSGAGWGLSGSKRAIRRWIEPREKLCC